MRENINKIGHDLLCFKPANDLSRLSFHVLKHGRFGYKFSVHFVGGSHVVPRSIGGFSAYCGNGFFHIYIA